VLNKDGSFQRTARFRGPDLDSAVAAELVAVAGRLNNAFRRLGSGWAIFVEAQRHPATYPDSHFPMPPRRWSMPSARPTSRKPARISSPAIS
jgi:type IV secretion system protein VirB4